MWPTIRKEAIGFSYCRKTEIAGCFEPLINRKEEVQVAWQDNKVNLGGGSPVVVQSMTNTDTVDVIKRPFKLKIWLMQGPN